VTPKRRLARRTLPLTATLAALCGACGSSDEPVDVTDLDLPTLAKLDGPVLTAPHVQPIYFPGFPYASDIDTFFQHLATSSYWPAVVTEYGVGALTALPGYATNLTVPASLNDTQLKDLLTQAFIEGSATLVAPRGDTIYALFLPPTSTLTFQGLTFCGEGAPGAYHDQWAVSGTSIAVAVIPTCTSASTSIQLTGVDVLTLAASHEVVEAATDPFPQSNPAWAAIDVPHILWAVAMSGSEVADLCENEIPNVLIPPDIGRAVQRIWSNASAKAGTGPCVPVPAGEVYFNAVADMPTHAKFFDPIGMAYSVPAMSAKIGQAAAAQISFRGGAGAPTKLLGAALEMDAADSFGLERPTTVMGSLGQRVAAPVATSATQAGLVPLVIAATDEARTAVHLWVGGINRE
jgi:hypothetical protein